MGKKKKTTSDEKKVRRHHQEDAGSPVQQKESKEARRQERISDILRDPASITGGKLIRTIPNFQERFILGRDHFPTNEIEEELFRLSSPETKTKIKCIPKGCDYDEYYPRIGCVFVQVVAPGSESDPKVRILKNLLEEIIQQGIDKTICEADKDYFEAKAKTELETGLEVPAGVEWKTRARMREHIMWKEMKLRVTDYQSYITRICFDNDKRAFEKNWAFIVKMKTLDEFIVNQDCLLDSVQWEIDLNRSDNLLRAALEVGSGAHVAELSCWECGKKKTLYHCPQCETARYCSEECQNVHWRMVHKITCQEMKRVHKLYEEGLAALLTSHSNLQLHETKHGVKASPISDSMIACKGIEKGILDDLARKANRVRDSATGLQGPSMENFYRNIKHVILDGFWFDSTIDEIEALSRNDMDSDSFQVCWNGLRNDCRVDFLAIAAALMYDYEEPEEKLNRDAFRVKVKSILGKDPSLISKYSTRVAMEWLCLYPEHKQGCEVDLESLQWIYKRMIFDQMRDQKFGENLRDLCKVMNKNALLLEEEEEEGQVGKEEEAEEADGA